MNDIMPNDNRNLSAFLAVTQIPGRISISLNSIILMKDKIVWFIAMQILSSCMAHKNYPRH